MFLPIHPYKIVLTVLMNMTLVHVTRLASSQVILNFSKRVIVLLGDPDCAYWAFTSWHTMAIEAFISVVIVEQGSKIGGGFSIWSQVSIVREINRVGIDNSGALTVNVDVLLQLVDPFDWILSAGINVIQDALLEKELFIFELLSWCALATSTYESDLEELAGVSVLTYDSVELSLTSFNAC